MTEIRVLLAVCACVAVVSAVQASESAVWDLVISIHVENSPVSGGENPVVSGLITDHAGEPVSNATVQIRGGQSAAHVTSDVSGAFSYELGAAGLLPGDYVVHVVAASGDKTGAASTTFKVRGELTASSHTASLLGTEEARRYLNSDPADFENDPIGTKLYNHYQQLQARFVEEERVQRAIDEAEARLESVRAVSANLTQIAVEENVRAGTYGGFWKDVFISNADPDLRESYSEQMNFTVSVFEEAQAAMDAVLADGGTYREARAAYLERASVSRDMMESIMYGNRTAQDAEPAVARDSNSTGTHDTEPDGTEHAAPRANGTSLNVNGTEIRVGLSGAVIFLSVNGTLVEFVINGTQIIPVNGTD